MREIVLDGKDWAAPDDLYDSFFRVVGSPAWHGRNFNALQDSIATGRINQIELPYVIRIKHYDLVGPGARKIAADFVQFIKELRESGCAVDIQTED
jgi:RNAse (barnase) inhibitor barstar